MNTINRISAASLVAAASLIFSPMAWSLGLGEVTVESFLNEPLQVKIDLLTRESDDLESVSAKLASASDYEMIGASREAIPYPIHFSVEDIEGDAYLLGKSSVEIGSPVLRLIVEVNWASGRLLREYTVFLDAPSHSEPAPIPRVDKRKAPPPPASKAVTEPAQQPAPGSRQTTVAAPANERAGRQPVDREYGPVASGETLMEIALDWSRGTGMEINKVMIAIQRENPQAFLNDNINLLMRDAILRMPLMSDIEDISTATAISEVATQYEEFRALRPSQFAEPQTAPQSRSGDSGEASGTSGTEYPLSAVERSLPASQAEDGEAGSLAAASPSTPLMAEEAAAFEVPMEAEEAEVLEEVEAAESDVELGADAAGEIAGLQDQLELVPPSEESELDSAYGFEEMKEGDTDASLTATALRENLARTEEELITQQQQNEYLTEQITELESRLATIEENKIRDAELANMQNRIREERLAEAAAAKVDDTPWYSRFSGWLIGLLVLVAAGIGWMISRRGGGHQFVSTLGSEEHQLREIKDEAKEVLRVLEDPVEEAEDESEEQSEEPPKKETPVQQFGAAGDDAEVLDEESSDPEIQLDLARAYISMGDKEAARVILEEVGNSGNEEQRKEAKNMLDLLAP